MFAITMFLNKYWITLSSYWKKFSFDVFPWNINWFLEVYGIIKHVLSQILLN